MSHRNIFTDVNMSRPSSNTFDLSHDRKLSCNMGELVPILCMETVPGDRISISTSQLIRFAPMLTPIMHQVNVYTHFFYVPNRIMWNNWEKFITGGEDGLDATAHPFMNLNLSTHNIGTLADHLGLPVDSVNSVNTKISPLPIWAYLEIWNEYYRDQNLQTRVNITIVDGVNTDAGLLSITNGTLFPRCWQHDYFTSALPWTQKGLEATIPLGTTAPIVYAQDGTATIIKDELGAHPNSLDDLWSYDAGAINELRDGAPSTKRFTVDITNQHSVDLSGATAAGIIDLRRAFKLQEWLEKNARGGSRYTEMILSQFGVRSSDARLQRPEFLGGSTTPVSFSEVLQTSNNDTQDTAQGTMVGHGISAGANKPISFKVEEWGYIMGIMSIMPKTSYFQGVHKHWTKFDKFDYFWTPFANIGEQAILNKEIMLAITEAGGELTFGYIPRYAEYKFMPSSVHGEFRDTLDFWHLSRKFAAAPVLNETFIKAVPDTRIFAVEGAGVEHIYAHVYHSIKATRLMPYFGNSKM